jgi:glycosyltransferase involved in cell wall biosynthesis
MKSKSKNILILSPFFYPEPISTGKYNTDIANALVEEGHHITIICSHPLYPKWVPKYSNAKLPNIDIIRGGLKVGYTQRPLIRRVILELWYAFFVLWSIRKVKRKIDIVIPIFPPSLFFFVASIFLFRRKEKIGIVHDLQEVYAKERNNLKGLIISKFIHFIEKHTFNACTQLIFLSEYMKDEAMASYKLKNRIDVQYPFATLSMDNLTNNLESLMPSNLKHIVYSGALSEKQNPAQLYEFYDYAATNTDNIHFHIFSMGKIYDDLKAINTNPKVIFHELVAKEEVAELYSRSTIQVIPQLPGTGNGSLPSKLPNILASGAAILVVTDDKSELVSLFKEKGLKKVITSWDKEILLKELVQYLEKIESREGKEEGNNKIIEELFSIDSLVSKIIK